MAIFGVIHSDDKVQVSDKFRILASKSYVSKGESAITLVEIQPEADDDFIDVTGSSSDDWWLDWEYATSGTKVVTLRITTDGDAETFTKSITCVTAADDNLFSDDDDLSLIESDILRYLPDGRSTYKYMHREAQKNILEYLYTSGYRNSEGERIQASNFVDIEEIRHWSKWATIALIYWDLKTIEDDIWERKALKAEGMVQKYSSPVKLKFDYDGDGTIELGEALALSSFEVTRR